MHLRKSIVLIAILLCGSANSQTKPQPDQGMVLNELAGEMTECSTYYLISAQCLEGHPDPSIPALVANYRKSAQQIGTLAITVGRTIGVTDDGVKARTKLSFDN